MALAFDGTRNIYARGGWLPSLTRSRILSDGSLAPKTPWPDLESLQRSAVPERLVVTFIEDGGVLWPQLSMLGVHKLNIDAVEMALVIDLAAIAQRVLR
jgi:hypothetical protein